jgi:hypothetical protein
MVICPKCKAENHLKLHFASVWNNIISRPTRKTFDCPPINHQVSLFSGFTNRPEGSLFGDRFQYDTLVIQGEHEILYTVNEINQPDTAPVRVCSNPFCRTFHCPVGVDAEKFCTQCGQPLDTQSPLLLLKEVDTDKFESVTPVIDLHLVHPNIHPRLLSSMNLHGTFACLVTPISKGFALPISYLKCWIGDLSLQSVGLYAGRGVVGVKNLTKPASGSQMGRWWRFHQHEYYPS